MFAVLPPGIRWTDLTAEHRHASLTAWFLELQSFPTSDFAEAVRCSSFADVVNAVFLAVPDQPGAPMETSGERHICKILTSEIISADSSV